MKQERTVLNIQSSFCAVISYPAHSSLHPDRCAAVCSGCDTTARQFKGICADSSRQAKTRHSIAYFEAIRPRFGEDHILKLTVQGCIALFWLLPIKELLPVHRRHNVIQHII